MLKVACCALIGLKGELTEDSLAAFQKAVDHHLADAEVIDVVLNMDEVSFMDSAALECLLDLQDTLTERFGQVKLAHVDETIRKILEITRLDATFETYKDIAEAVQAVQA